MEQKIANQATRNAVSNIVSRQMAEALIAARADLDNAQDVRKTLLDAGFGEKPTEKLSAAATDLARARAPQG